MIFKTALNINISNSINQSDFTTSILLNLLFYLAVCLINGINFKSLLVDLTYKCMLNKPSKRNQTFDFMCK